MSLDNERMIALMQYADGELDGEENEAARAAVMASLESDPDARAFLDEMDRLGDVVRAAEPLALSDSSKLGTLDKLDKLDICDAVMGMVDEHEQKSAVTTPIITRDGDGKTGSGVSSLQIAREKRRRAVVIEATGLALAAGIALVLRSRDFTDEKDMKSATATNLGKPVDSVPAPNAPNAMGVPALPSSSEAALAAANAANAFNPGGDNQEDRSGVEVNMSDSPQTGVSVFYLPGSDGTSASAVVWIDESSGGNK